MKSLKELIVDRNEITENNFTLLSSFELTVPIDFSTEKFIENFKTKHKNEFYFYQESVNDQNVGRASEHLEAGQSYIFKFFEAVSQYTSQEALKFYKNQQALMVGIQAEILAWQYIKNDFPKGKAFISFDEPEVMYSMNQRVRVPVMERRQDGAWRLFLGHFDNHWGKKVLLLCVRGK